MSLKLSVPTSLTVREMPSIVTEPIHLYSQRNLKVSVKIKHYTYYDIIFTETENINSLCNLKSLFKIAKVK